MAYGCTHNGTHDYGVCTHTCHAMARESLPGMLFCVVTYDLHATSTEWLWAACQFVSVALRRSFCEVPASTCGTTEQIHTSHCLLAVSIHRSEHTTKQQQNKTMSDHHMIKLHYKHHAYLRCFYSSCSHNQVTDTALLMHW